MLFYIYLCILYVDVKAFSREQKITNEILQKNLFLQKLFMRITITACPSLFHSRVSRTFDITAKVLRRLQCWIPELRATGPFFSFFICFYCTFFGWRGKEHHRSDWIYSASVRAVAPSVPSGRAGFISLGGIFFFRLNILSPSIK